MRRPCTRTVCREESKIYQLKGQTSITVNRRNSEHLVIPELILF